MRIVDHRLVLDGAPVDFRPTPNKGGTLQPRFLVMHYTAGRSAEGSADWLCNPLARASAHLVIGKDGRIIQLLPFNVVAWHAGVSHWHDGRTRLQGLNQHSIGIELDNPGRLVRQGARWRSLFLGTVYDDVDVMEAVHKNEFRSAGWHIYPSDQLEVAFSVAASLVREYRLEDVIGHDDIAPDRKSDPGPAFPMDSFRSRLFGRTDDGNDIWETTTTVNVRLGPGTQFSVLAPSPVPPGTRVRVLGTDGSWRRVDVLDSVAGVNDLHGWMHENLIRAVA
jgi:N-acetylmuramoyl-L-alanine amidase